MKKAVEQLKAAVAAYTSTSSQSVTDAVITLQSQLNKASSETASAMLEGILLSVCPWHYAASHQLPHRANLW